MDSWNRLATAIGRVESAPVPRAEDAHHAAQALEAFLRRRVRPFGLRDATWTKRCGLHLEGRIADLKIRAGLSPSEPDAPRASGVRLDRSTKRRRAASFRHFAARRCRAGRALRAAVLARNPGLRRRRRVTLALGIGANTVVFSVAKAVLLRPLGFDAAEQLVWVRLANTRTGTTEDRLSWREIEDIRESTHAFESLATFASRPAAWEQGDRVEELPSLAVTPNLANVLRVRPVLGRPFLPSDAEPLAAPVVLVSYELWQTRFGGTADVIGQKLRVNETVHTVIWRPAARASVSVGTCAVGWKRQQRDDGAAGLLVPHERARRGGSSLAERPIVSAGWPPENRCDDGGRERRARHIGTNAGCRSSGDQSGMDVRCGEPPRSGARADARRHSAARRRGCGGAADLLRQPRQLAARPECGAAARARRARGARGRPRASRAGLAAGDARARTARRRSGIRAGGRRGSRSARARAGQRTVHS